MKNFKPKHSIPIVTTGICLVIAFLYSDWSKERKITQLSVPEEFSFVFNKSEIGDEGDPYARFNYHINLQVDPATGRIPWGIYQREKEFIRSIPERPRRGGVHLRTAQSNWAPLGPTNVGGRTRAFAIDVTNLNVLVAGGVSGSMWRSDDGGRNWEITSDPNSLVGVTAVAQDTRPGRENTWYYGTGEIRGNSATASGAPYRGDGIFKSTDGARSWTQLASTQVPVRDLFNSQFNYIYQIVPNHTRTDIDEVLVAAFGGILRSDDGGESWTAVLGNKLFGLEGDVDLNEGDDAFYTELKMSDSGVFYAYMSQAAPLDQYNPDGRGVFRSDDGISWTDITPPNLPDSANRGVLAIAPTNESVVYMFVDHGSRDSQRHSLWSYRHQQPIGEWTDLSDNIPAFGGEVGDMDTQNSYNMVLEVHPNDENIVFVGGTNLYRSLDGFRTDQSIEWVAGYDTTNNAAQWPQHHADQHNLYFLKNTPFRLYSTHDGGISFTDVGTIEYPTWVSLNSGYVTSQFYAIDIQQDEANDLVIGGTQDNGSWLGLDDSFGPWNRVLGGDGAYSAVGERARFLYASAQNGRVFRLIPDFEEERIASVSRVDPLGAGENGEQDYLFINPFILDPNDTDRMFVAGGDAIWRNHNVAQIPSGRRDPTSIGWQMLEETILLDSGQITTLVASVDVEGRVYYGTSDGRLFRIDQADQAVVAVSEITAEIFPQAYIANVNVNPENADELLVIFSSYGVQSIFRSLDGGTTYEVIAGNLEEFEDGSGNGPSIRWGTVVPMNDGSNNYYVGTSSGLFSTDQLQGVQTVWMREGVETIGQSIVTMIKYRPLDGRMAVATHGNGVYFSNITGFKPLTPPGQSPAPFDINTAYPNPFTDRVSVDYTLPKDAIVLARIFDLSGNLIKRVLFGTQLAGTNHISWDGTNNLGQPVPDGIYVLNVFFDEGMKSRRLILNR